MKLYLAGPMSGVPDFNSAAFAAAAAAWRAAGHEVYSPAEADEAAGVVPDPTGDASGVDYPEVMRRCLTAVLDGCEAVAVLPRWWQSYGASLEVLVAVTLGLPVYSDDAVMPITRHQAATWVAVNCQRRTW